MCTINRNTAEIMKLDEKIKCSYRISNRNTLNLCICMCEYKLLTIACTWIRFFRGFFVKHTSKDSYISVITHQKTLPVPLFQKGIEFVFAQNFPYLINRSLRTTWKGKSLSWHYLSLFFYLPTYFFRLSVNYLSTFFHFQISHSKNSSSDKCISRWTFTYRYF